MSDTRFRELERRWKETGSPDDEAAYLLERVRVGDLTQERLELAARWGSGGAQVALGISPPLVQVEEPGWETDNWRSVAQSLVEAGPSVAVPVGVHVVEAVVPVWEEASGGDQQARRELHAASLWLDPCVSLDDFAHAVDAAYATAHDDDALYRFGDRAAAAGYAASQFLTFVESGASISPTEFDAEFLADSLAWASFAKTTAEVLDMVRTTVIDVALRAHGDSTRMKRAGITPST